MHFEHKLLRADLDQKTLVFQAGMAGEGKEVSVRTDFIFGCDGAHSTVRRQMMRWGRLNYAQEYIDTGYKELTLPATEEGEFAMPANYLHIWPRHEFMMIALPNFDCSFTVTLLLPYDTFDSIKTEADLLSFFTTHFHDAIDLIGVERLKRDYFNNQVGKLISVKCNPHFMAGSTLVLGDAAHAVVPFYGQGMNAGFEDCHVFYNLLAEVENNDLLAAAQLYQDMHWKNTQTICDLSIYNYLEMRSHVTSLKFLFMKQVDRILHLAFPRTFIPLYSMVAFTQIPYHEVVERHRFHRKVINGGLCLMSLSVLGFLGYVFYKSRAAVSLRYRILPCVLYCIVNPRF